MGLLEVLLTVVGIQILVRDIYAIQEKADITQLDGDVTVAGMFAVRDSEDCANGITKVSSVQEAEAIRMTFKMLNENDYIPGVKIGFKAFATCESVDTALKHAELLAFQSSNKDSNCPWNHGGPVVGLIGPETSTEARVVSRLLGGFGNSSRLLQIGYSTTAPTLSDKNLYPNFFRVVQSDVWQVKTMVELLLELNWTYIALVYEDNIYGREASNSLMTLSKERGICVQETVSVNTTHTSDEIINFLKTKLETLQDPYDNYIGGLIFIGGSRIAQLLAKSTDILIPQRRRLVLIFSEGVNGQDFLFRHDNNTPIAFTKGSYVLNPFSSEIMEFKQHWKSLFQNLSKLVTESYSNSWLMDLFLEIKGCQPFVGNCSPMSEEEVDEKLPQVLYSQYALRAALTMAWTLKKVLTETCPGGGVCLELCSVPGSEYISKTADSHINFRTDFLPFYLESLSQLELVVSFDNNKDIHLPDGIPAYEVQNFRKCSDSDMEIDTEFCLTKVGTYMDTSFFLDHSKARDYTLDGTELKWPYFHKAQCPDFSKCVDCTTSESMEDIYHIPGDLYVIAIVPIHDKGTTSLQCGSIRTSGGFELAEAIMYAISKSTENNLAIPDSKIGVIVVDSCNDNVLTQQKLITLHRSGLKLDNGEYMSINDKTIGYIGGLGSGVTIPVADISNRLGLVQISYGSTSPVLSDRDSYPFFLRIPSPDNKQTPAILSIVKQLGSNLIQLLYSDGPYGEGGRDSIMEDLASFNLCIANSMPVADGHLDSYSGIITELRKHAEAKIVVLFLRSHVQPKVLQILNHQVHPGEFLFIGSEGWGNRDFLMFADNLVGSLTIAQILPLQDGFREHMSRLHPTGSDDNKWLQPYMESRLGCYYQWSFDKLSGKKCSDDARLDASIDYKVDAWTPFAIHATIALLLGAHDALLELCGTTNALCDAYKTRADVVVERIKDIRLDINNLQIESTIFDENGEGMIDYIIYNVQNYSGQITYKEVGRWFGDGGFEFRKEKLVYPGGKEIHSTCTNHPACKQCFVPEEEEDDTELILTVIVGILAIASTVSVIAIVILIYRRKYATKGTDDPYDKLGRKDSDYTYPNPWSTSSGSFQPSSRYTDSRSSPFGISVHPTIHTDDDQPTLDTSPANVSDRKSQSVTSKISSSSSYVDVSAPEFNTIINKSNEYEKAFPVEISQTAYKSKPNNLTVSKSTTAGTTLDGCAGDFNSTPGESVLDSEVDNIEQEIEDYIHPVLE